MATKLNDFPLSTQNQILFYLAADNFKAAKELYDLYQENEILETISASFPAGADNKVETVSPPQGH